MNKINNFKVAGIVILIGFLCVLFTKIAPVFFTICWVLGFLISFFLFLWKRTSVMGVATFGFLIMLLFSFNQIKQEEYILIQQEKAKGLEEARKLEAYILIQQEEARRIEETINTQFKSKISLAKSLMGNGKYKEALLLYTEALNNKNVTISKIQAISELELCVVANTVLEGDEIQITKMFLNKLSEHTPPLQLKDLYDIAFGNIPEKWITGQENVDKLIQKYLIKNTNEVIVRISAEQINLLYFINQAFDDCQIRNTCVKSTYQQIKSKIETAITECYNCKIPKRITNSLNDLNRELENWPIEISSVHELVLRFADLQGKRVSIKGTLSPSTYYNCNFRSETLWRSFELSDSSYFGGINVYCRRGDPNCEHFFESSLKEKITSNFIIEYPKQNYSTCKQEQARLIFPKTLKMD